MSSVLSTWGCKALPTIIKMLRAVFILSLTLAPLLPGHTSDHFKPWLHLGFLILGVTLTISGSKLNQEAPLHEAGAKRGILRKESPPGLKSQWSSSFMATAPKVHLWALRPGF